MDPLPTAEELFARTDWAATPLGPRAAWPRSLAVAADIALRCRLPMYLAWGPQRIQVYNQAYTSILGRKHPAAMGAPAQVTWAEIWPTVAPMWERVDQGESIGFANFVLNIDRHGQPERLVFDFSYSPITDDAGAIGGVLVTCLETTERVALEARLAAKAERLRKLGEEVQARQDQLAAIVDSVPAAVISVNRRFEIVLFNHAAERIFRVPAADVVGRHVDLLVPEGHRAELNAHMQADASGERDVLSHAIERELVGRRWDGEAFPMEASLARTWIEGELLMTLVGRDLTEVHELRREKLARAAAEEANAAKGRFISQLSHELRTPLHAVLGFAQLLEYTDATTDPAQVRDHASRVVAAGQQQLAMIDDLLELSRVDENALTFAHAPVPLPPLVRECAATLASRAERMGVVVELDGLRDPDAAAWADPARVRQVLVHLLSNAVKYNRAGGTVRVACRRDEDGTVTVTVRDSGPGIPAARQPLLFTPFERLGRASGPIEGAGLGLALSQRLARAMGGELRIDSAEGAGTTAKLTLPAA